MHEEIPQRGRELKRGCDIPEVREDFVLGHVVAEGGEGVVGGAFERDREVGGGEVAGHVGGHVAPAGEEFFADEVEADGAEVGEAGGLDALEEV